MPIDIDAINAAEQAVSTGSDFPQLIATLKQLGLKAFSVAVADGRTAYISEANEILETKGDYETLNINPTVNVAQFITQLQKHQAGFTDYPTFCQDCADQGIAGWYIDL